MTHTPCFIQFSICHEHPDITKVYPLYTTQSNPTARFCSLLTSPLIQNKKKKGFKTKCDHSWILSISSFNCFKSIRACRRPLRAHLHPKGVTRSHLQVRKLKIQDSVEWTNPGFVSLKNVSCILESPNKLYISSSAVFIISIIQFSFLIIHKDW